MLYEILKQAQSLEAISVVYLYNMSNTARSPYSIQTHHFLIAQDPSSTWEPLGSR